WSIVARVVQSIGAGAVIPISLAAAETLVGVRRRIVAFGMVGAAAEAGSVFGPVYAGAIADWIGWEYTFWSNIPLSLIAVAALAKLPKGIRHDTSVDWIGAIAFTAGLTTLTVGLFRISEPDLPMILLFVAATVLTSVVAISNRMASEKAVPRSLGKLKDFIWSNVAHFFIGVSLMIGLVSVPLLAGTIYGLSALDSGLLLMRMTIALGVSALAGGIVATYFGVRIPAVMGLVVAAIGFNGGRSLADIASFFFGTDWTIPLGISTWGLQVQEPRVSIDLVLVGIGLGILIAPIAESALRRVPEEDKGIASGLLTLSRNIGMTAGLAVVASLGTEQFLLTAPGLEEMIERPEAANEAGMAVFSNFFTYASTACIIGVIPAWLMTRNYEPDGDSTEPSKSTV
ncbi:MAG: MFS transporter, partial [Chloroflexi bacterium]|nr:MFS transporter [Chloroflexota bacterium]